MTQLVLNTSVRMPSAPWMSTLSVHICSSLLQLDEVTRCRRRIFLSMPCDAVTCSM